MAKGRLAQDKILESSFILQDDISLKTIVNAPLLPPTKPSTFSFLVSFEKFHVTAASKAGYNKIYEFRRSKSFFFEVVDQIPDTNEIHLKIYTNDYRMSSNPIRFHFGIYVACNHISTKSFSYQKPTPCIIPCPFVKNFGRHACAQHHLLVMFNKKFSSEEDSTPLKDNIILNNKSVHANIVYEKYNNHKVQKIFSNRLGISYHTQYIAHDLNAILPPNKVEGPMYTKLMDGFTRTLSANSRTARRQNIRFDRAQRRVFKVNDKRVIFSLKLQHKVKLAHQNRFLFYHSQKMRIRVPHLKFNKALFRTSPTVPLYRFPYDRNCSLLHIRDYFSSQHQVRVPSVSNTDLQETVDEDITLSDDNVMTNSEDSFRNWYISNLIDEHYGAGASEYIDAVMLIQDSTVLLTLRDAQMLGLNDDRIAEIKSRDRANERIDVIKDIKDHNTSTKHYLRRTNSMTFYTQMNDQFHEKMAGIRKYAQKYRDEHYPFRPYRAIIRPNDVQYVKDDLGDTSDDTKIIERRPKKRRSRNSHYYNSDSVIQLTKKTLHF
ncbi:unnamed protein product [Rhizophagus irregularis]|nr:unnamed protein product [Rhizophagus irregularis]